MEVSGGCYCGEVRYQVSGPVLGKGMCLCRECQHVSAGGGTFAMVVAEQSFRYTQGTPRQFARSDLEAPATRDFCGTCGTHLVTHSTRAPKALIVKAGTLDDPSVYGLPDRAIYVGEKQVYHVVPEGVAISEGPAPRR